MPIIVSRAISKMTGVSICELENGPPDEIIYYIVRSKHKPELTQSFLDCMKTELRRHPQIECNALYAVLLFLSNSNSNVSAILTGIILSFTFFGIQL